MDITKEVAKRIISLGGTHRDAEKLLDSIDIGCEKNKHRTNIIIHDSFRLVEWWYCYEQRTDHSSIQSLS